jgi:glutamate carboxypeptidase
MMTQRAASVTSVFSLSTVQMLDDLRRLVEVESPSRDVTALTSSADNLASLLGELLGSPATVIEGADGPHVLWSGGGEPKVLLLGHHDTVFPLGTLADRPFAVTDGRATGPGVFDMKAGIVQAVHALALLAAGGGALGGVELLCTADEEVGSTTSRALLEERAVACGAVLVLEPSADGGALKTGRKGTGNFLVSVHGRAAHAGLEPEKGINALVEAAHQVLAISALASPEKGTTVTPTVATAGTADNVVPAEALIRVDVRVIDGAERQRVLDAMNALTTIDPAARVEVTGGIDCPPMPESASAELYPIARRVAADLHLGTVDGVTVGGGSDGNFTAAAGVPTLDGMGAVGGGAHADHEYVEVDSMVDRSRLLAGVIAELLA